MPPPTDVQKSAQFVHPDIQSPVDLLLSLIIRPPRSKYPVEKLGPKCFRVNGKAHGRRTDIVLQSPRGHELQCSFFEPAPGPGDTTEDFHQPPCVIFLHGNSSCRLEAMPLLALLMPLKISLFCFDFSGSGLSEGEYISLGWFERDDLATCIGHLRSTGRVSSIALWGRSMGAFTALLHADRDPSIAGLVLDSPFSSLKLLAQELAQKKAFIPSWATSAVLAGARSSIQFRAGFDIDDLEAENHVSQSFMPALFIAAKSDDFVAPHHSQGLFESYQGEKEFYLTEGDHQSARPEACRRMAVLFLCRAFHTQRLDELLRLHTGGLVDIFAKATPAGQQSGNTAVPVGYGREGVDGEGADICGQMHVIPALNQMALTHGKRCQRPLVATVRLQLLQDTSEAGYFIRLEPAGGALAAAELEATGDFGHPCLWVLSVSAEASVVSRVHSDALRTQVVGPGLTLGSAVSVEVSIDRTGTLALQIGANPVLKVDTGQTFRCELTLWCMQLRGPALFLDFQVEDSEATLREHLGDTMLRLRHLGHSDGVVDRSSPRAARQPGGDAALSEPQTPRPRLVQAAGDYLATMQDCASKPEVLVGWRVKVKGLGEGVVTGIRERLGRSTQHLVAGLDCKGGSQRFDLGCDASLTSSPVVLSRKQSRHFSWFRGRPFELLRKEF
eukprot:TRINITY_DN104375_c0_g1_i1.p1 TRINITY_DN104375_c0_g1~~TRINITY_DN104375_c0_g1_i1.p1  ORF type:complete len:671 (+),score=114.77 TRINITY_DN104375_c0_g1_i1:227-2239(+)